jgi:hypothetical protein
MREMNKPSLAPWLQQPAVFTATDHPIQPVQTWHINNIKKKLTSTKTLTKQTSNENFNGTKINIF